MDKILLKEYISDCYRYAKHSDERITQPLIKYYQEGAKSPSAAQLLMRDMFQKNSKEDVAEIVLDFTEGKIDGAGLKQAYAKIYGIPARIQEADYQEEVAPHLINFAKAWAAMYPASHILRNKLIAADRIKMDYVTPKASWFQKLKFSKMVKEMKAKAIEAKIIK